MKRWRVITDGGRPENFGWKRMALGAVAEAIATGQSTTLYHWRRGEGWELCERY